MFSIHVLKTQINIITVCEVVLKKNTSLHRIREGKNVHLIITKNIFSVDHIDQALFKREVLTKGRRSKTNKSNFEWLASCS